MSILLLILGLMLFVALVVVHEFGHFIMARKSGVEVEEFGIGFPPRAKLLGTRKGTRYSLNWLPLGGFVRLKGEHDSDRAPGSFGAASLSAKTKIMLAGVVMNLATAYVILIALAVLGMPKLIDNQFTVASDTKVIKNEVLLGFVEPDSPANTAGLEIRDRIMKISPIADCADCAFDAHQPTRAVEQIGSIDDLVASTHKYAGQKVSVDFIRGGESKSVEVTLRTVKEIETSLKTDNPKGYLGIEPTEYTLRRSTWSAPIVAAGLIKQFTVLTFQGLGKAIGNLFIGHGSEASAQVAGPVGIYVLLKDGSVLGYQFILTIIAIISLTLAIMNALPIPALDGGRLFVMWLFRLLKRPLTKKREDWIHGTGFAMLMVLFVLITIVDVRRNF